MDTPPTVHTETIVRNANNLAVWVYFDSGADEVSTPAKLSLLNAEMQTICNDYISTLDDELIKKSPRPNPAPRVFIEQGNELSRILWLRWED